MSSQIEEIAEYEYGDRVWRTTCKCMGDDHLTFTVATDNECPEVYLEFYMDCSDSYSLRGEKRPFRWFKCIWLRINVACKVIFTGHIKTRGAFIFRGEKHIDEFCDTIQTHKKCLIKRRNETKSEDINLK